ncbi:MAG: hypothetical protein AMXMBFR36_04180 [Acidobacteriota bacterium]
MNFALVVTACLYSVAHDSPCERTLSKSSLELNPRKFTRNRGIEMQVMLRQTLLLPNYLLDQSATWPRHR